MKITTQDNYLNLKHINENAEQAEEINVILNENIGKEDENISHNLIKNKPIDKRSSLSILRSPKKELIEFSDKRNLGDLNSLIKSRFKDTNNEVNSEQQFFLTLNIPANVKKSKLILFNFSFI